MGGRYGWWGWRARDYEKSADRQSNSTGKSKGGGDAGGKADPCDISFEVDLTGVIAGALKAVSVGDKLDIAIVVSGGYEAVVCQIRKSKTVVGTLAGFPGLTALIACIKQGNVYTATITKIHRGRCVVNVQRA